MRVKTFCILAAGILVCCGAPSRGAYRIETASTNVTFHPLIPSTNYIDIPGLDPALGPIQGISYRTGFDGASSSGMLTWVMGNNSGAPVTNQRVRVKVTDQLEVGAPAELLNGSTSSIYSPSFDLAMNDEYYYPVTSLPNTSSSHGGVTTPSLLDWFDAFTVQLRLTSTMTAESYPDAGTLSLTGWSGQISGDYDVTMVYKYLSSSGPAATMISSGTSAYGDFDGIGTHWYQFLYTGGPLTIDTLGSTVDSGGENNTAIGLYNYVGALVGSNDDGSGSSFTGGSAHLSQLSYAPMQLTPGVYFLAVGPGGTEFESDNYNANPFNADPATGQFRLNINNAVPEPHGAMVAAVAATFGLRRRAGRAGLSREAQDLTFCAGAS